jgi:hypothetical protein
MNFLELRLRNFLRHNYSVIAKFLAGGPRSW